MKALILLAIVFIAGCATVKEENIQYSNKCVKETSEKAIIDCHWDAIFYKMRAKWWMSTNGLTESDYPVMYKIKTEVKVDEAGNILDIKLLSTSNSRKLDRSVIKGIKRSTPLPVPKEPLFTKGGFSIIKYNFVHDTGDVKPVFESE